MKRHGILIAIWIVLLSIFSWRSPEFPRIGNLLDMTRHLTEIGIMALPMTALLISGAIDLSVASMLAMSGIIFGWSYRTGIPTLPSLILSLLGGVGMGALNGVCIAFLRLPPIIVTLATMTLFRGLAIGITGGEKVSGFPKSFITLGQGYIVHVIPMQLPIFFLLAGIAWFILTKTIWGRYIYAIGANEAAARFSGVPVSYTKFMLFVVSGLMSSLAGILYVARFNTAKADAALGSELDVITASLLGGTPITGGEGSLMGTVLGLLLLSTLRRGLDLAQVGVEQQAIVVGIILICAVALGKRTK
jgi:ribose/xylose/arabinose/galactoside ABC-type transport system permease subunit